MTVGFQKIAFAPRLTGMAAGGLLGAAAAPEDQTMTGALTGAGMGYAAGALGDRLHQRFTRAPIAPAASAPAAPQTPAVPHPGYDPEHLAEVDRHLSGQDLKDRIDAAAPAPTHTTAAPQPIHGAALPPDRARRVAQAVAPASRRPIVLPTSMRPPAGGFHFKGSAYGFGKLAEHGVSVSPQGASLSLSSKDERLRGMDRWIPRQTLEQAFTGTSAGLDDQAILEEAARAGNLKHPAVGAAIGAALAHYGVPANLGAKILGAGVGAGVGSMFNNATASNRVADMREALKGVHQERGQTAPHVTAREAPPVVVSSAAGDV